jgi:hypothetical protein
VAIPGGWEEAARLFCDLTSEVPKCYFCHHPLVKQITVTNANLSKGNLIPSLNGRRSKKIEVIYSTILTEELIYNIDKVSKFSQVWVGTLSLKSGTELRKNFEDLTVVFI